MTPFYAAMLTGFLASFADLYDLPHFLYLSRKRRDIVINVRRPFCKICFFLPIFTRFVYLFTLYSGSPQYRILFRIRPMGSKFFHKDEQA